MPATTDPMITVEWTDDLTGSKGYLVIDRLVRGVSSGGLRMRAGCTLDEVRGLARGMTRKEALHYDPAARYVPLGGAKGGIDCDPRSPESTGVLVRYLRAMRPHVEHFWTTGEDLGLTQARVDAACAEAGLPSSILAIYPLLDDADSARTRLRDAFAASYDGISLDELAGGCGVAESALVALDHLGIERAGARVAVQGLGTMGGATALFLARAGLHVVAVADQHGTIVDERGLDVPALLAARDEFGALDRDRLPDGLVELDPDAWLGLDVDVLVPAAVSYYVDDANEHRVRARLVVEAANMPVLPGAEARLAERGTVVLPDVVVNSGTNAWWWWTLFGDIDPEPESAFTKIRASMQRLVGEMLTLAEAEGITARAAADRLADDRLAMIADRFEVHR